MKKLKDLLTWFKTPKTPKEWGIIAACIFALWFIGGIFAPAQEMGRANFGTAIDAVTGTVKVTAALEVTVKTQVEGRLSSMKPLDATGKVLLKEGETFAQMDTITLDREIDLFAAREKILKSQIEIGSDNELAIGNARSDLGMAESLFRSGQASSADVDRKKRELERLERAWEKERLDLERNLSDATFELQTRKDRRARMTLVSPIRGDMCQIFVVVGQYLPQETPVALIRSQELSIDVSLAEEDFPGVSVGQSVTLSFTGIPQTFKGHVTALAAYSNPDTRRRSAYVSLDKPTNAIVPGATGYATIVKAEKKGALIVPRRALIGDSVYYMLFGTLHRQKVKTGYQSFASVQITDGIWPGTAVALAGTNELKDGLRVRAEWVKP